MCDLLWGPASVVAALAPPRGVHGSRRVRLPYATRRYFRPAGNAVSTGAGANPGYAAPPCPRPVGLVLVASDAAVNIFGLATRYTARAWLPQVESSAEEVARELVSRAVETTGIPGPHPRWTELHDENIPLIEVGLRLEYPSLVVEVWDGDRTSPYPLPGAYLDDHLTVCTSAPSAGIGSRVAVGRSFGPNSAYPHNATPTHHPHYPNALRADSPIPLPMSRLSRCATWRICAVCDGLVCLDSDRAKGAAQ